MVSGEPPSRERDDGHRHWHALDTEAVLAAVESDADGDLSAGQARYRLERFGPNALPEPKGRALTLTGGEDWTSLL